MEMVSRDSPIFHDVVEICRVSATDGSLLKGWGTSEIFLKFLHDFLVFFITLIRNWPH